MLTTDDIKKTLMNEQQNINPTDTEVNDAHATVDTDAIRKKHQDALTVEKWDKSSPINGCSATEILNKRNIPGEAYLIKRGDKVVYFQTTRPHVGGNQPINDAATEGKAHADELAERAANGEILNKVKDTLTQEA